MSKENKEKLHYDDVVLERKTVTGIVLDGRFYGDEEHIARWQKCTHISCEKCGKHTEKHYRICLDCREESAVEKWKNAEKRPVSKEDQCYYSDSLGEYFSGIEDIEEHEHGVNPEELRLYHCERSSAPEIDLTGVYEDLIPDGLDIDDMITEEIADAAERLNRLMSEHPVNSFFPTKIAVTFEPNNKEKLNA